jgi:phosphinothricin acetyltransferase
MKLLFRAPVARFGSATIPAVSACIRIATPGDAPGVHAIYAPIVRDTVISFELQPPTCDEISRRIESALERHAWVVCEDRGMVAGYAYATSHRARAAYQWAVDVSVYNQEDYRGRGVGRALYTALFAIVSAQGYRQACAGIALPNEASVALHEAMGFEPVGVYRDIGYKLGAWHSVGWWQLDLGRDGDALSLPGALADLDHATVDHALQAGSALLRL